MPETTEPVMLEMYRPPVDPRRRAWRISRTAILLVFILQNELAFAVMRDVPSGMIWVGHAVNLFLAYVILFHVQPWRAFASG